MKNIEQAQQIAQAAEAEGRALTTEERETVQAAIDSSKAFKADADLRTAVSQLGSELATVKPTAVDTRGMSAGKRVVSDPNFKAWLNNASVNGSVDGRSLVNSPQVEIGGIKATITGASDSYAGALIMNDRYAPVEQGYARPLNVLNLVTFASTNSDVVEYARVANIGGGGSDNNAAPTAEGSSAPESQMIFVKESASVKDVRTFIPASVRALNDAPQLQSLVDSFIRYSIQETLVDEILNGDNTGERMIGLFELAGTQAQAFDTDIITTIRQAIRKVRQNGNGTPTAVLLNPEDDAAIDLLVSSSAGEFLFGGPAAAGTPTIWGLPRVSDSAVPQGQALVGDFRQAVVFERSPLTVSVYPQHSDYAIKGLVAIVGTTRAAFAVLNPAKFAVAALA